MTRVALRRERGAAALVLLAVAICSSAVAWSAVELENANADRRERLATLVELVGEPLAAPAGPVGALDGLYGCRLLRVETCCGAALSFAAPDGGER